MKLDRNLILLTASLVIVAGSFPESSDARGQVQQLREEYAMIQSGNGPTMLAVNQYTPLSNPVAFKCPSDEGCTIGIAATAQIVDQQPNTSEYQAGICSFVDGNAANPNCITALTDVGDPGQVTNMQNIAVSKGKHTIQTKVYYAQPFGGTDVLAASSWQATYTVFQPL